MLFCSRSKRFPSVSHSFKLLRRFIAEIGSQVSLKACFETGDELMILLLIYLVTSTGDKKADISTCWGWIRYYLKPSSDNWVLLEAATLLTRQENIILVILQVKLGYEEDVPAPQSHFNSKTLGNGTSLILHVWEYSDNFSFTKNGSLRDGHAVVPAYGKSRLGHIKRLMWLVM
ncbi:uncharacterized protein LOC141599558 isoform X1 [Silene latifolia]|uniref:uncharacterized protein LOC141599558 isoform X1 n=1 Tax=Silene latifolia TaxID=37657 RepID=UPI003D76E6E2